MSILTITIFFLGNALWALALLSLLLTESQVNLLVGWTGLEIGTSPVAYLPVFLILTLGSQIVLFYLISKLDDKKKFLSKKVRETQTVNKTLNEQSVQKDREMQTQSKNLEKTQSELQKMKEQNPKKPWWQNILPK